MLKRVDIHLIRPYGHLPLKGKALLLPFLGFPLRGSCRRSD